MSKSKRNTGIGIGALLSGINPDIESPNQNQEIVGILAQNIALLDIKNIEVNPYQPRVDFDAQALEELKRSIETHGLIQPITVRHLEGERYQLISGERRLRASQLAQLAQIPAYVRLANDEAMMEMALIENIQRQDLNPIEVALSFERLMQEFKLTHEELSQKVGKERSTISNYLGLLRLPAEIQAGLKAEALSMGHAKALKGLDILEQLSLYREILRRDLSVRQTEMLARQYRQGRLDKKTMTETKVSPAHHQVQEDLAQWLSTKVNIKKQKGGRGQIIIHFMNDEHLNGILDNLDQTKWANSLKNPKLWANLSRQMNRPSDGRGCEARPRPPKGAAGPKPRTARPRAKGAGEAPKQNDTKKPSFFLSSLILKANVKYS